MKPAVGSLIVFSALLASPGGLAGDKKTASAERASAESSPGKVTPRLVVTVDLVTGGFRPATAAERAALAPAGEGNALFRAPNATVMEKFADGRIHAKLGFEVLRYWVARRLPDGTVTYENLSMAKAEAALPAPTPAASTAAEEK